MAIPESQLDTWSHQGAVAQSKSTYAVVRAALESSDAGYAEKSFDVFLQGSYCNDTNIHAESDVDVVMRLDSVFHYSIDDLTEEEKIAFHKTLNNASYMYDDFNGHVIAALRKSFGSAVNPGPKATHIDPSDGRRNADVIAATQFRRYLSYSPETGGEHVEGICFFTSGGMRVVNYPKQHSSNCTTRHQATGGWFKPTVRILKNARSKLVADGVIQARTAPSYFLEGLLYNVPVDRFGESYEATIIGSINWILEADRVQLVCANEQHYLLRDSAVVCWAPADCELFLTAFRRLWEEW